MGKDGGGQRVRCGSSTLALSRRLVDLPLRLLEKDVIVLLEKDVNAEEERQSGSSSGWVSPLHVQRTACSYEFSCMEIVRVAFGRKAALRKVHSVMTMVRFFSFFAPRWPFP